MSNLAAKQALDKIITKARVQLYKPIQIAEILYRSRVHKDINVEQLETYRTQSKKWRDEICLKFLSRTSTSSTRYQDDLFNENAIPPAILKMLDMENKATNGGVEAYIYTQFKNRFSQMSSGLDYCQQHGSTTFQLSDFIAQFWNEPGLRRNIDKIYEIIVYALFSTLVEALEISVEVQTNPAQSELLREFEDFTKKVINLSSSQPNMKLKARINRVGVTNAADRGLDMWANFGLAIQIKHLSLTEEMAENIVSSVSADRIVIVCKDSEQKLIVSLLTQIGWKAKIQSIITESDLLRWYEKGLRGEFAAQTGKKILLALEQEIKIEFPTTDNEEFTRFIEARSYPSLIKKAWG